MRIVKTLLKNVAIFATESHFRRFTGKKGIALQIAIDGQMLAKQKELLSRTFGADLTTVEQFETGRWPSGERREQA